MTKETIVGEKKSVEEREKKFNEGYQKLVEETQIALQAIIAPTGPVLQKVDLEGVKEQQNEDNTKK